MNPTSADDKNPSTGERRRERAHANGHGPGAVTHDQRMLEVDRLREVGRNLGAQIDEQVHKRPYVVVGAAAAVGFVAGSLFGSRLGQVLLAAGLGYVLKNALGGELTVDRIQAGIEKLTGEAGTG